MQSDEEYICDFGIPNITGDLQGNDEDKLDKEIFHPPETEIPEIQI